MWRGVSVAGQGNNLTTVRGGPMDSDTPGFGLDFGPNTLSIAGTLVHARLENVTAKQLLVDLVHGSLLAVDMGNGIGSLAHATVTTQDADVTLTTQRPTTARVWQHSADLTCVSAAAGSLYSDSPCQTICDFVKPPPAAPAPARGSVRVEDDFEPCLGLVPRPLVAGCYDPVTCAVVATQYCFCKPSCEKPYSDVDGVCQARPTEPAPLRAPPKGPVGPRPVKQLRQIRAGP